MFMNLGLEMAKIRMDNQEEVLTYGTQMKITILKQFSAC